MEQMENSASRAALKSRNRPLSRASTASIHSVTTQPNMDQSGLGDTADMYSVQWMAANQAASKAEMPSGSQMPPEAMIIQAATHLQATGQDYPMDGSMGAPMNHNMAYQQKHSMNRHPLPQDQYNASFDDSSQMLERSNSQESGPLVGMSEIPRPGSTRSSANNELEMRQLFQANRHRNLQEIAGELHGNERGPNSERNRQMFAMIWISHVCSKGKGSVPRGRVYANYASRCATERITVLNPASFGKLVRVLFPGLKTRRLGVRGESKYHYVNFALVDDQPNMRAPSPQPLRPLPEANSFSQSFNTAPAQSSNNNLGQGALPSPQVDMNDKSSSAPAKWGGRSHSFYNQPDLASLDHLHATSTKTELVLAFPPENEGVVDQSDILALPPIEAYLPPGTDPDAAKSLSALYRSHCTSLVECIRFCREKTFFHLYTSFQGTLTMPVQKLFANPAIAIWIEECDFVLYQQMMRILAGLTLQVCPKPVLDTLRNISEKLVLHIRDSFQGQPQHVIQAKEAPAALFAGLLDRTLRVNLTAHAAANMLSNPANRDQMYLDWITMIRARKIAECVPTRGMDDVVNVLLTEMRELLDPVKVPWEVECLTIYGDAAARSGRQLDVGSSEGSGHNVLDRWVAFLRGLPARFPYASHSDIVWCVERVGTAVMRDITLQQGKSFGTWWVTKTWLDEMVSFLASQGGFMKLKSTKSTKATTQPQASEKEVSRQETRYSGDSEDLNMSNASQGQAERAPFPPGNGTTHGAMGAGGGDAHDDSGIGIRTPEEEFPMDKYEFPGVENQNLMISTGVSVDTDL